MEDDKLRELILSIGLDEPGAALTDSIMKIIETKEEISLHPAILSVIKNELLAEPSFEFADTLMENIKPKGIKSLKPVITKKTGLIILGIFIPIVLLVLINSHSSLNHLQNGSYFSRFSLHLPGATRGIIKMATAVLPYLVSLSSLLFIDYFFRTRQRQFASGDKIINT